MGTTDAVYYRLTCPNCGAQETVSARETGSSWSASWGAIGTPKGFNITQSDNGPLPSLDSAVCKECGVEATKETATYSKPSGW